MTADRQLTTISQSHEQFGEIQTVEINGDVWFAGKDVAEILGYERPTKAIVDRVDEDDRNMIDGTTQSQFGIELGQRGGWLINESGLYSLILSSKLPTAKEFKHWVTSEVLPSIRKHGMYAIDEIIANPDLAINALIALRDERKKNKKLETTVSFATANCRAQRRVSARQSPRFRGLH